MHPERKIWTVMMMLISVIYLGEQGEGHTPREEDLDGDSVIYLGEQGEGHAPREEDLDSDDDVDFCHLFRRAG